MISIYITLYSVPFCLHCQIHFHHDYHHHHQSSFFPSKFLIFTLGNCKCLPTPLGGCWQYILCIFQMISSGGSGPSILLFLIYILRLLLLLLMIDHPDSLAVIDVFLLVFKWKIGCDKILYWGGPKNSAFVNQYVAKCAFSSKYGGGGWIGSLNWLECNLWLFETLLVGTDQQWLSWAYQQRDYHCKNKSDAKIFRDSVQFNMVSCPGHTFSICWPKTTVSKALFFLFFNGLGNIIV